MTDLAPTANRKLLGWLFRAFGAWLVVAYVIIGFLCDTGILDFMALIVIWLAGSLSKGSTRAPAWLRFIMLWYALVAVSLTVAYAVSPEYVHAKGSLGAVTTMYVVFALLSITTIWAVANLLILWKHRLALSS